MNGLTQITYAQRLWLMDNYPETYVVRGGIPFPAGIWQTPDTDDGWVYEVCDEDYERLPQLTTEVE